LVDGEGCSGSVQGSDDSSEGSEPGAAFVELMGDLGSVEDDEAGGDDGDDQEQAPFGTAPHEPGEQQRCDDRSGDQERGLDVGSFIHGS
jgi:hypothetical protein